MKTAIFVAVVSLILVAFCFTAEAGSKRPMRSVLIPANACPIGQTYKIVIKSALYDKTIASVPCAATKQCVSIGVGWTDDTIFGRVAGKPDVLAVPAVAGDVCP